MNEYIAYCGLDCESCEARIATVNDDNGVEISPEMINCVGCRIDGVKTPFCDSICPIRQCASARKYETCADCAELGECEKVKMIFENNPDALKNLERI